MKEAKISEGKVVEGRAEILILFRDGLSEFERQSFLHELFAREYALGRHVDIKRKAGEPAKLMQTNDGFGVVLEVPWGWEDTYVAMLHGDPHLQFVQRHHRIIQRLPGH